MEECRCYRLCENLCWPFGGGGGQGPKKWFFSINYIRIMWFIWDLGLVLCDSPKDVVSREILIFGNILCFPGVNWAQIWTKTVNFGYVPFPLKDISFKDCLYSVIGLSYSTSGPNFSKIAPYLGEKGLKNPPKWAILWMLHRHKTIWNFITWEPQML